MLALKIPELLGIGTYFLIFNLILSCSVKIVYIKIIYKRNQSCQYAYLKPVLTTYLIKIKI